MDQGSNPCRDIDYSHLWHIQSDYGAQPASYSMCVELFYGVKAAGTWHWPLFCLSARLRVSGVIRLLSPLIFHGVDRNSLNFAFTFTCRIYDSFDAGFWLESPRGHRQPCTDLFQASFQTGQYFKFSAALLLTVMPYLSKLQKVLNERFISTHVLLLLHSLHSTHFKVGFNILWRLLISALH